MIRLSALDKDRKGLLNIAFTLGMLSAVSIEFGDFQVKEFV